MYFFGSGSSKLITCLTDLFATLCRQAGRKKLKFKLVNYSVYYPAKTQDVQESFSFLHRDVLFLARFLQILLFSCKAILHLQDPCKIIQDITDKIQALKRFLFPDLSQRESTQILCRSKVNKYLSFFHFPKITAGKSVKQANKFELPH